MFTNKKSFKHKICAISKKTSLLCFSIILIFSFLMFSCESTKTESSDGVKVVEPAKKPKRQLTEEEKLNLFLEEFYTKLSNALNSGSIDDALALYDEVPEQYANNYDLTYIKASLLISKQDYAFAKEIANQLLANNPDNTEAMMLLSVIAKGSGDKAGKTAILQKILAKEPYHAGANTELGHEQMLKANYKLANRYYLTALAGESTNLEALAGYGQSSYYLGNIDDAKNTFWKMLEIDETNAFAWAYLGKLEAETPDYEKSLEYVLKAIQYEPDYYDYWLDCGTYYHNLGKNLEAEKAWTKAIELRPDYFLGYVYRGGLYDEQEMVEKAYADYKMVNQLYPEYYYAYESLGILAWGTGDYAASREGFQKAYEIYPASTSYPMMIAASYYMEAYEKQGTPEEAALKKAGKDYLSKVVLKKLDKSSTDYAIARLFYDNVQPASVAQKVENEASLNKKGRYLFYLAMYYQIRGNDNIAQKYYINVQEMQSPTFFEYRLNDWAIEKYKAAGIQF